jgi:rhodanese-related sulfurtransferase
MNQNILVAILVIAVISFWGFKNNFGTGAKLKISPADAKARLDIENEIFLLDVRTKAEYQEKHIPNSTLIPLDILEREVGSKIPDKNTEIFVYCRSGSRSSTAVQILLKQGYTKVYNLGGILSWPYETLSGNK